MDIRTMSTRRALATLSILPIALALTPAAAAAQQPFTPHLEVSSTSYQAGASPSITATISKNADYGEQRLRTVYLELPSGLLTAAPGQYCDLQLELGEYFCANQDAQIGTAEISAQIDTDPGTGVALLDTNLSARIYAERPSTGEIAELVTIPDQLPSLAQRSAIKLAGDRLAIEMADLPTSTDIDGVTADIHIHTVGLSLSGTGGGRALIRNPTLCDPANGFSGELTSYGDDGAPGNDDVTVLAGAAYPVTGCDLLAFAPTAQLALSSSTAGQPAALKASVALPDGDAAASSVRISMPPGFLLNPSSGVASCDQDSFESAACEARSQIGTVSVTTPLLDGELTGTAVLGPPEGSRVRVGVFLPDPFSLRLDGSLEQRSDRGLDLSFELPPLPVTSVGLDTGAQASGILLNPVACGTYDATVQLASHSGATASLALPLTIDGCVASTGRLPTIRARLSSHRPGRHTNLRLDESQDPAELSRVRFRLPRGLDLDLTGSRVRRGARLAYIELWDAAQNVHRGTLAVSGNRSARRLALSARNRQLDGFSARLTDRSRHDTIEFTGMPEAKLTDFSFSLMGRSSRLLRTPKTSRGKRCTAALGFEAEILGRDSVSLAGGSRIAASDEPICARSG